MKVTRNLHIAAVVVLMFGAVSAWSQPCNFGPGANSNGFPAVVETCGQVGIGTATPNAGTLVHIKSGFGQSAYAMFDRGSDGADGGYLFRTQDAFPTQWFVGKFGPLFNESVAFAFGNPLSAMMVIAPSGNVGIGVNNPAVKLDIAGDINVTGNIAAKYQDVAEWVPATNDYAPGTVVVVSRERGNEVVISSDAYDTAVAGVVSLQPGLILGEKGIGKEMIATTGRVKVRVDASERAVKIGDLLVTSSKPGYAMVSEPVNVGDRKFHQPGTIVGKALESLEKGQGEILVLLSLQ